MYYDGPAGGGICGRSASSPTTGGTRRVSFVFLQGDPGCRVGGYGTGNGWPARTAAHELLHAMNDYFAPDTAPNACEDRGHVCDSAADILSTGTSHPSPRLFDAVLDIGHDDYYDHAGSWWDIRDSEWLVHLEVRAGHAHGRGRRAPAARSSRHRTAACAPIACTRRYDGDTPVRLTADRTRRLSTAVVGRRLFRCAASVRHHGGEWRNRRHRDVRTGGAGSPRDTRGSGRDRAPRRSARAWVSASWI